MDILHVTYPFINDERLCYFQHLAALMLLWTFMNTFCMNIFSVILDAYIRVELLGIMVTLCWIFLELPNCFPPCLYQYTFPLAMSLIHSCQHNFTFQLKKIYSHPSGYEVVISLGFWFLFPGCLMIFSICMCLLAICITSLEKCFFKSFTHFFSWIFCLFIYSESYTLTNICFVNAFF